MTSSIVCEEFFDESSQPSIEEIRHYASKIGIDPDSEPQLLPLAAEGLMKALPPGWRPCLDEKTKAYYYHNNSTGKTQWEHPLDDLYRGFVKKVRAESQSFSLGEHTEDATYTRDDLPSYEEAPNVILPNKLEPLPLRKKDIKLSPLKRRPKIGDFATKMTETDKETLQRQKSEERPAFNKKISLNMFSSFDDKKEAKFEKGKNENGELTLSGGGSMFLKSNTKKQNSDHSEKTSSYPKSILRENSKLEAEIVKPPEEDEEKKSVRFKLDKNPQVTLTFSDDELNDVKSVSEGIMKVSLTNKSKFEEFNQSSNLKLIKPNPIDFIKPELKDKTLTLSKLTNSDSDDDSVLNSFKDEKATKEAEFKIAIPTLEATLKEENIKEIQSLKKLLEQQNYEEMANYKQELFKRQQLEIQQFLLSEKKRHEENITKELETLRDEMEARCLSVLNGEKLKLEVKLEKQKADLEKHYENEALKWEQLLKGNYQTKQKDIEKLYEAKLVQLEKDLTEKLEKTRDELIVSHSAIVDQIKQNHSSAIDELNTKHKSEEEETRAQHIKQISELKGTAETEKKDTESDRQYEKIRCEKRLLEDKYRCLKEKYVKLKGDVKVSLEKRRRRREQSLTTTTGSDTEISPSIRKERSSNHPDTPPTPKHVRSSRSDINCNKFKAGLKAPLDVDTSASDMSNKSEDMYNKNDFPDAGRSRKKIFSRLKSSSASRVNNNVKFRDVRSHSPVENLRRQLQKLEDLEDQFPQAQGDTYHLRYPFSDDLKFEGSSELEFFRHRIHLERDYIKRAKESLRSQKSQFQQKQKELKLKHGSTARNTLQQLCQEEKELTDMEVSLHRTRSLLGEKVIRLRHLEQSLQRASREQKQEDATLSDLSSHSGSSGISSTEFAMADQMGKGEQLKETSEILHSLENLNSEIREIWEVLRKQQQSSNVATVIPPLPFVYPDLGWPVLASSTAIPAPHSIPTLADRLTSYRQHIALANAQSTMVTHDTQRATTTLVEKTKNLRQWLRQTSLDHPVEASTAQATL